MPEIRKIPARETNGCPLDAARQHIQLGIRGAENILTPDKSEPLEQEQ